MAEGEYGGHMGACHQPHPNFVPRTPPHLPLMWAGPYPRAWQNKEPSFRAKVLLPSF